MLNIGDYNKLTVAEVLPFGYELHDDSKNPNKVFLSSSEVPEALTQSQSINAFVYVAQDDSLHATLKTMPITLSKPALLTVKGVTDFGTFFDWGLERDLLVPRSGQHKSMDVGMSYMVQLVFDEEKGRLVGSTKMHHFLAEETDELSPGQAVELRIYDASSLGYKAIIDKRFIGLLYHSDLFKTLHIGDTETGFIKGIREDGKIDLSLQRPGKAGILDLGEQILEDLEAHGGISTLTDKSSAQEILARFNVSKGAYKRALGNLYKQKKISLSKTHVKIC